jgi:radical SAM superfamily enzyme YgiQ (UPF0313 family)
MKILLINPPVDSRKRTAIFLAPSSFDLPLNLCYLATPLIKNGHYVKILDLNLMLLKKVGFINHNNFVSELEKKRAKGQHFEFMNDILTNELKKGYDVVGINGDFVGISTFFLKQIKNFNPKMICVVGGHTASRHYEIFLKSGFDFVILGDGEQSFLNLINNLKSGKKKLKELQNVAFIYQRKIFSRIKTINYEKLPPLRELVNYQSYINYTNITPVLSSRGCKGACIFCSRKLVPNYFLRNVREVVSEIRSIHRRFHLNNFLFYDDNINNDEKHLRDLCLEIIKNKLKIIWACYSRAENLSSETIQLMSAAGCRKISFGVESGSRRILKIVDKNIDLTNALRIIKDCKKNGMSVRLTFIYDLPYETWKDLFESIKFLIKARPSSFHFHKLRILSGSLLYKRIEEYFNVYTKDIYYGAEKIIRREAFKDKINIFFKDILFYLLNKIGAVGDLNIFHR